MTWTCHGVVNQRALAPHCTFASMSQAHNPFASTQDDATATATASGGGDASSAVETGDVAAMSYVQGWCSG